MKPGAALVCIYCPEHGILTGEVHDTPQGLELNAILSEGPIPPDPPITRELMEKIAQKVGRPLPADLPDVMPRPIEEAPTARTVTRNVERQSLERPQVFCRRCDRWLPLDPARLQREIARARRVSKTGRLVAGP